MPATCCPVIVIYNTIKRKLTNRYKYTNEQLYIYIILTIFARWINSLLSIQDLTKTIFPSFFGLFKHKCRCIQTVQAAGWRPCLCWNKNTVLETVRGVVYLQRELHWPLVQCGLVYLLSRQVNAPSWLSKSKICCYSSLQESLPLCVIYVL